MSYLKEYLLTPIFTMIELIKDMGVSLFDLSINTYQTITIAASLIIFIDAIIVFSFLIFRKNIKQFKILRALLILITSSLTLLSIGSSFEFIRIFYNADWSEIPDQTSTVLLKFFNGGIGTLIIFIFLTQIITLYSSLFYFYLARSLMKKASIQEIFSIKDILIVLIVTILITLSLLPFAIFDILSAFISFIAMVLGIYKVQTLIKKSK